MGRRKFHKRSRQKAKFHEVQQSFRQHARSSKRRRYDSKATSNLQQNSPELMLSESQHEDLLYDSKLSPEIVSKSPKIKLQVETCGDGAEIGDDISVRRTEQSQRKSCDFKRNAESTNSLLRLEGYSKHDITKLITGDALDLTDASSSSSLSLNNGENKTADVINDERPADEDEEAGRQRRSTTRVEVPPALSEERRKRKQLSFPPTQPSCDKTCRDSRSSESTSTSDLDQPALTDYDSLQEIECQAGTCKRQVLQTTATSQDSQNHAESRQRSIPRMIISWVIAFYGWLKKKLLHLSDNYKKLRQRFISSPLISEIKTDRLVATLRIENKKMMCELSERMTRLSTDFNKVRTNTETTLNVLTTEVNAVREASKKMNENNTMLMLELKKLRGTLEEIESKSSQPAFLRSSYLPPSSHSLPPPPAPSRFPPSQPPPIASDSTFKSATSTSVIPPPPPPPPPSVFLQSPGPSTIQPTTPNSSRSSKCRTPTRKCSTPLLSRPSITVEDLLKVTLKKAPQSIKDNRRNSMPGPRGPVVSLEMLRNVKLKSTKRRLNDQTGRSPRSGRIVKNRATSNISLSPILTGSEGNLERILRRVDSNRPRRLLSASSSLHEHDFVKETQSQSLETLTRR
ncbi:formin BNI1 isoform X2 [Ooceraea biroi]|uniref:formin BNI1 isoform X2 n=1 Tax=Ooceraea biroi TaxID=2015173 RepID=UPI0005BD9385|nr:formin BNI1 isoform X2 [Ooceraea biroi]